MYHIQFHPPSTDYLLELEMLTGAKLPPDYNRFILESGGGQLTSGQFKNEKQIILIDTLFGSYPEEISVDLKNMYVLLKDRIPPEMLTIGSDGVGNFLCICLKGDDSGKIFMWWADRQPGENEQPSRSNMECISNSFDEFLEDLAT